MMALRSSRGAPAIGSVRPTSTGRVLSKCTLSQLQVTTKISLLISQQCRYASECVCCAQATSNSHRHVTNDVRIKVVGLGGGGGNAVNRMVDGGVKVCPGSVRGLV
jgi:hypothetical protein